MAGQILGNRYQVERQIGKQTGRWTLLARDLTTQELVVLKLLFLDEQLEWDDLKLFEREVEILKSLSHPCIPRYLGYFEHELPNDKALVLIQTYVEGKSLEQCIQEGRRFNESEAKQLAKALLGILSYLHGRQPPIVHRDIKPSNILLANRQLYLVDFGSVKTLTGSGDSTAFTIVGTYGYMPPEQFSGRALPASDLYSLAATLIALIAGTHPSSLPHQGVKIDLSAFQLSPEFADWLGWLTESSLERRAKTVQEALDALDNGRQKLQVAQEPAPVIKPEDSKITLTKEANNLEIILPSRLGQTYLQIDPQQIALSHKRLGFQTGRPQTSPRQSISRLEIYQPAHQSSTDHANPQIFLWAGGQKYELTSHAVLTEAEVNWLAYELATWLKLPISNR